MTCPKSLLFLILGAYVGLLAWSAKQHSPTYNEIGHVPAGISHWKFGLYDLYRVNPPLPRMVATFPLLFLDIETDWSNYSKSWFAREQIPTAVRFTKLNGQNTFYIFTIARLACIPFCLLGAWICFRWACELWGDRSGWMALILWCTSPFILGHGPLVMPDVPATAIGLTACYLFWKCLQQQSWCLAAASGIALGLSLLSKTTLLVFFIAWPVLWYVYSKGPTYQFSWLKTLGMTALIFGLPIYVINVGYNFTGSGYRLGDFNFQSEVLSGGSVDDYFIVNRFSDSWLGAVPVPLPRDYVLGIDQQRTDFEIGGRSYLCGQWQNHGWWYYYLYGMCIKIPIGTLLLFTLAVAVSFFKRCYSRSWADEFCVLFPAITVLAFVSSQTGFSSHVRYIIPVLPFLFIWISKLAQSVQLKNYSIAIMTFVFLAWTSSSSLWFYPHSISYFNELAGGPRNGHYHLLESNVSWGQDLLFLKKWVSEHEEAKGMKMALLGWIDPQLAGIEHELPLIGPSRKGIVARNSSIDELGPQPGWYAIDVSFLHGTHWPAANGKGSWTHVALDGLNWEYFQHFSPVDSIGYSIHIYHITIEEANRVRKGIGLPQLPSRAIAPIAK